MKAKVIWVDEFLKTECKLFKGSIVTILKQKGTCCDVLTVDGKEVTLRNREIKILKGG